MLSQVVKYLIAGLIFCWAVPGYSLINGKLQMAPSYKLEVGNPSISLSGSLTKVAVHVDPIPLVPVSAGITSSMIDATATSGGTDYKDTGAVVGLELMAWSPVELLSLTPYLRFNTVIQGSYTREAGISSYTADVSGSGTAIGVSYSPVPLIALLLEYDTGSLKLAKKILNTTDTAKYTAILFGVEVGI